MNTITVDDNGNVYYNVDFIIGGLQWDVDGATITSVNGGDAQDSGFTVQVGGSTILGFSFTGSNIPAGCGILTLLDLDGTPTGLSNIIFDDGSDETSNEVNYHQP